MALTSGKFYHDPMPYAHRAYGDRAAAPLMSFIFSPRTDMYPADAQINRCLRALRDGFPTSDPYEFLQILGSQWAMQFSWAERKHAFEVVDRMLNVRHLSRVKPQKTE